jgi:hypothetical protein
MKAYWGNGGITPRILVIERVTESLPECRISIEMYNVLKCVCEMHCLSALLTLASSVGLTSFWSSNTEFIPTLG